MSWPPPERDHRCHKQECRPDARQRGLELLVDDTASVTSASNATDSHTGRRPTASTGSRRRPVVAAPHRKQIKALSAIAVWHLAHCMGMRILQET